MKICCISDSHNHTPSIDENTDLLIHAGDFFHTGRNVNDQHFIWYKSLKPWLRDIASNGTKIIATAGNHCYYFEKNRQLIEDDFQSFGGNYIEHGSIEWNGITISASAFQPIFFDWAFNRPSADLQRLYAELPPCDILLTHCPPFGHLDLSHYGMERAGSRELLNELPRIRPRLACWGHIHHSAGIKLTTLTPGGTPFLCVNAAVTDEQYNLTREPIYLEWQ